MVGVIIFDLGAALGEVRMAMMSSRDISFPLSAVSDRLTGGTEGPAKAMAESSVEGPGRGSFGLRTESGVEREVVPGGSALRALVE